MGFVLAGLLQCHIAGRCTELFSEAFRDRRYTTRKLMAGINRRYALGSYELDDEQLFLSWHGMYTIFENDLEMALEDDFGI